MIELRSAMRRAGCSTDFIYFVSKLLKDQTIVWNDTKIETTWVSIRVEEGYHTIEIYD